MRAGEALSNFLKRLRKVTGCPLRPEVGGKEQLGAGREGQSPESCTSRQESASLGRREKLGVSLFREHGGC